MLTATHLPGLENEMLTDSRLLSDEASCIAREIAQFLNFEKAVVVSLWNGVYTACLNEWDGPTGTGRENVPLVQIGPSAVSTDPTCLDVIESRTSRDQIGGGMLCFQSRPA